MSLSETGDQLAEALKNRESKDDLVNGGILLEKVSKEKIYLCAAILRYAFLQLPSWRGFDFHFGLVDILPPTALGFFKMNVRRFVS